MHSVGIVILPKDTDPGVVEDKLTEMMEPFGYENGEILGEYNYGHCSCLRRQQEKLLPVSLKNVSYREYIMKVIKDKYPEDLRAAISDGDKQKVFKKHSVEGQELFNEEKYKNIMRIEKGHLLKPEANCSVCKGTGRESYAEYDYNYNPHSHWDWWSIGGRWSGFINLKTNQATVASLIKHHKIPCFLILPTGEWVESYACVNVDCLEFKYKTYVEMPSKLWASKVIGIYNKYKDHTIAVCVDIHN